MFQLIICTLVLPWVFSSLVYFLSKRKYSYLELLSLVFLYYILVINIITLVRFNALINSVRVFTLKTVLVAGGAALISSLLAFRSLRYLGLRNKRLKLPRLFLLLTLLFSCAVYTYVHWLTTSSSMFTFQVLLFNLKVPLNTTNANFIRDIYSIVILPITFGFSLWYFLYHSSYVEDSHKSLTNRFILKGLPIVLVLSSVTYAVKRLDLINLVRYYTQEGQFIEEHYVEASDDHLIFPEQKRNLIVIFAESFESTYFDVENGGARDYNLLPNMTQLLEDGAINFSHNETQYGGMDIMPGATWSIAGMTAQLSGVPYKVPVAIDDKTAFLPGIISIGDILEKIGYSNVFMVGSDATEFGISSFYKQHGNHEIIDYYSLLEQGKLPENYREWWGLEDKKLFDFGKDKLLELGQSSQPFSFVIETNDTHFPDGYLDKSCAANYDKPYANSVACEDQLLGDFITWIKEQDFYENTSIVVVGDHLSMDTEYFEDIGSYHRTVFNMFINPDVSVGTDFTRFNRRFYAADMYPTILRSLGVTISNNRLGLGTDLFSEKETLFEELGLKEVQDALLLMSRFYDDKFLYGEE